jgi:hypothetical protein
MRELSTRMIEAVLEGSGLQGVAELATSEAGGPVAIVLPGRGLAARAPRGGELNGLLEYAKARVADMEAKTPQSIAPERSIEAGGQKLGMVLLLETASSGEEPPVHLDRDEVLRAASLAALAEVAVADARDEAEQRMRGGLIVELRSREIDAAEVTSKAARLGCDLARGAIALVARIESASPSHATALVEGEYEGSLAELAEGRLYAILPARGGDDAPELTLEGAGRIARRLRKHGQAAVSSFYPDPGELHGRCARPSWCWR